LVAATWASLVAMGQKGYLERADKIYKTSMAIKEGVKKIKGIYLLGDPTAMVVSWGSHDLNIFAINDKMAHRGWSLNPIHRPAGMHICVTNKTIGREADLLKDLAECVEEVRADPSIEKSGNAPMYGLAATFPDRGTVKDLVAGYLDVLMELRE
jgi:sphinganine-1-phosphate aldolase